MCTGIVLLAVAGMILQGIFIAAEYKERYVSALVFKTSAACIFCIIGLAAMITVSVNQSFANLVVIGLLCGLVGDFLLNLQFVFPKFEQMIFLFGAAAFFIGHILYLCAIIPLSQNLIPCLAVGSILALALLLWFLKTLTFELIFKICGVFYFGVIVLMTAVAFGNVISAPSASSFVYAIGALLFTLSDIILILYTFGKEQKFSMRIANLSLYYLGQLLIAFSLFYI